MLIRTICVLGGSGFVGKWLCNRLSGEGYRLRVLTRNREANRYGLILLPNLDLVETNIHNPGQLHEHFRDCDAVINLVGILNEHGRSGEGFRRVHVDLTEKIVAACRANDVRRLLHMSALNADPSKGTSHYLRTKGQAEEKVRAAEGICSTIFRPSIIFGPGDWFFNRFARLLHTFPLAFPLACPKARFAPVYVDDVAEVFVQSLKRPDTCGRSFNLCGPRSYTLEQLVKYTAHCSGARRWIVPLSDILSRLQASVFDFVPGKPFSTDNYLSAQMDSVCSGNDFEFFGITPTPVESHVPTYLAGKIQQTRYQEFRSHSRRDADA